MIIVALILLAGTLVGIGDGLKYSFENRDRSFPYSWRKFDARIRIPLWRLLLERFALSFFTPLALLAALLPFLFDIHAPDLTEGVVEMSKGQLEGTINMYYISLLAFLGFIIPSNLIIALRWRKEKHFIPSSRS